MVVAIDGPAGSGKSTVARVVAERAGFIYLNSGLFYRAITLSVLASTADPGSPPAVISAARRADLRLANGKIALGEKEVESLLHTDAIDEWVAHHSAIPEVRDVVNQRLRQAVRGLDAVVEGRDITTVVFPDAEIKIYLDASIGVRAKRRHDQGVSTLSLSELEKRIAERDKVDRNKPVGALRISTAALYLDTSDLTIEQVCEKVLEKIRKTA